MRGRPAREQPAIIEESQFLSGWKEIATYLGKGVRTVQRYERHMGLPVRRPAGKAAGSVVATRAELDAWVKASPIREVFTLANPFPESQSSTLAIKAGVAEMLRLREQMSSLQSEVRRSLDLLRQSVSSLQHDLSTRAWENRITLQHSVSLLEEEEIASLERTQTDLLNAPTKYPKAI